MQGEIARNFLLYLLFSFFFFTVFYFSFLFQLFLLPSFPFTFLSFFFHNRYLSFSHISPSSFYYPFFLFFFLFSSSCSVSFFTLFYSSCVILTAREILSRLSARLCERQQTQSVRKNASNLARNMDARNRL